MLFEQSLQRLQEILHKTSKQVALAFSHQIEDVIALDLVLKSGFDTAFLEVFTLDTHKLFQESLAHQKEVEDFFGINICVYQTQGESLLEVEREIGEWGMRESLEKRKKCCEIRKIIPLKNALRDKEAWISGIRAAQSITRANISLCEQDTQFGLLKINPLFDWNDKNLWEYAKTNQLPINPLYQKGFKSIGCSPCTRAVREDEDIRAGRWWWEDPNHKECGLHQGNS